MDYSWFWDERFWFPANRSWGWKDLELKEGSGVYLPQINDLYAAIPFGVALVLVRFMFERLLVVPFALRLGVSNRQRTVQKPYPVLETAFKQHKSHCPDHKTILDLSKQTDLPERAIQIWFRRRKLKDTPTPLQKFRESSWQLLFYTVFFIYGMMVVWNKPYLWKTRLCWVGWPGQHVSQDLYWYYITELAFYWSQIFTLFYDHRRKDFIEMMIHHVVTIGLLSFSWVLNFVRIGSLVLVVHDAADSWLSLSKLSNYVKHESATTIFFVIFLVVWILSRLMFYPYVVLYSTSVEAYGIIYDEVFGSYFFFNVLLYTLQVLHILWSYMIFRILVVKLTQGHVRDVRSDDEDSEDVSDNNVEKNGSVAHGDKTKGINPATFNHKSTN